MITRSLEGAQQKIEGFNFDARKHVLEFDDVLNFQRKIFYGKRQTILAGGEDFVRKYIHELYSGQVEGENAAGKLTYKALATIVLQAMDMYWVEHLETMDYMRSSVNLRAYGQRDPLVEYKREGLQLFKDMEISIGEEIKKLIPQMESQLKAQQIFIDTPTKFTETTEATTPVISKSVPAPKTSEGEKVGRNDPCPCGSGKKWKRCGELNIEEHQKLMAEK
jgi:preprotein translocase subunit SecA